MELFIVLQTSHLYEWKVLGPGQCGATRYASNSA